MRKEGLEQIFAEESGSESEFVVRIPILKLIQYILALFESQVRRILKK